MKKIFTLFIVVGAVVSVHAQSSRSYSNDGRYERDVILGDRNNGNHRNDRYDGRYENNSRYSYSFSARERDRQVDRLQREFDKRIRQVERDCYLRSYEKNLQIRRLEDLRRREIAQVWDRFRSSNNLHTDNRYQRNTRRW